MKLQNRFDRVDSNRYWYDHQYCAECGSNKGVALHHLFGCKQWYHASLFNSYPLCIDCHSRWDGFHGNGIRHENMLTRALAYTMRWLIPQHKTFEKIDVAFLESVAPYVQKILSQ